MATQDMMSPVRHKAKPEPSPLTPGTLRVSSIQPSPNRTEAAAAMMNLLSGNTNDQKIKTCPALKPTKAKRRYVRRVPKKVGTSAKRQIKTALMDADAVATGKPPVKAAAKMAEDGDKNGDWRMDGDEVRFFPFREYNRKEKSLGLLCENFLKLYRDDKIAEICLDRAATELGVERRRIYDIVNILESIHLVSRKSKNLYNWHGLASLPKTIGDMKQRYAEAQKSSSPTSSSTEYPPIKSDRRRGKSLSKLSQMFVQLFLGKEDCIIPLDQAAKQLIQMEESESEEDRLLKTKIRRLYDVANVLVSVGLIEKLQLSNSRKPVFRWKTRSSSSDSGPMKTPDESSSEQKFADEEKKAPSSDGTVDAKTQVDAEMDGTDVMKSPQSCDSDMFDEGSDSQSDASSCGSKRKQDDQEGSDVSMSDGESSAKRSKLGGDKCSPRVTLEKSVGLLRMDADNEPIPPQIIYCEQQEQVKLYMQQYIREYVEYLAAHQKLPQASNPEGRAGLTTPSSSKPNAIAAITKDIHGTPVSLPSLAGSIQELLLSESPQSVADLFAARVLSNSRPLISTSSPVAAEPEAEATPMPLVLSAAQEVRIGCQDTVDYSIDPIGAKNQSRDVYFEGRGRASKKTMRKPCQRNSTRDRDKAELAALRDLAIELDAHLKALSCGCQLQPRRDGAHSAWKGFADRQARARRAAEETNRALNQRVQSNADWIHRLWELLHEKRRAAEAFSVKRTVALQRSAEDDLVLCQLKQHAEKAVLRSSSVFIEHGVQLLDNPLQTIGGDQVPEVWTHQSNGDLQSTFVCVRRVPFDMQSTSTAVWASLSCPKGSFTSNTSLGATSQEVGLKTRIVERTPSFSTMKVQDRILLDSGASVIDYHAVVRRSSLAEHAKVFVWHSRFLLANGSVAYEDTLWIAVRRCPSGRMESIVAIVGESQLKPKEDSGGAASLQAFIMPAIEACVESMLSSADDLLLNESVYSSCSADEMSSSITV